MPNTQNAFAVPPPASQTTQQARQTKPSQAQQTNQAKPSYKRADKAEKADKKYNAAKDDGQDSELTSFMALLNQAYGQADDKPDSAAKVQGLLFPDGQGDDTQENDAAAGNVKQALPKSILDLMASLEGGMLNELKNGAPDLDLKVLEAMLSKLRDEHAAASESGELQSAGTKKQKSDSLKALMEAPLADEDVEDVQEEAKPGEAEHFEASPQMGLAALPAENQGDDASDAAPQPLTIAKFHAYLKPDVPKEAAAQDAKPSEKQAGRNASPEAAAPSNPETKPAGELPASLTGEGEQGEKHGSDSRKETSARSAPVKEAAPEKGVEEPKARTNFTENRTDFEQFFDNVMARRDTAASPQLELAKGSPLSRAETLREGLDNVVRFIRANGEQRASLIVDPPALGRISVELTSSSTGLEASIKVSSEQVRQLIQDHLTQFKLSLEQQGVQLTHFSVDVQQDNERRNQGQDQGTKRRRTAGVTGADEEDSIDEEALFRVDLNQGLLYWVA